MTRLFRALVALFILAPISRATLTATTLRTENQTTPTGLDTKTPRFSWTLESPDRAQKQSAYRIQVATDPAKLAADQPDLWDTGKVPSADTTHVQYAGKPLPPHAAIFWKIQAWDAAGTASPPSVPATFSTGFADPSDFKAQWIGYDKPRHTERPEAPFAPAQWIAFANDKPLNAPKGHRVFMTSFTLPADAKVETADLLVTGDDKVWFVLNGQQVVMSEGFNQPKQFDVTARLQPGENTIRAQIENGAPGPTGLLAKLTIRTADGKTTTVATDDTWRATDAAGANWHNRPIPPDAWPAARAVAAYGDKPWGTLRYAAIVLQPAVHLRTTFRADKPVKRAVAYTTALGIHDLHLNGRRVSDDWFNPGWTDYTRRVYSRAYDVTSQIRQGDNAIGALLADGWYSGYVGFGRNRDHYGKNPRLATQLHIEYQDGTTADIVTGPDWKAAPSATTEADFLMGETHDARRELAGWDRPAFDASAWDKVDVGAEVKPIVQNHPAQPVRVFKELKPVKTTQPRPNVYVLDMGQNFAGVVRLSVTGAPGQKITLRFAERLNPDGTLYTTNLRDARATDTYYCKGTASPETWTPRFTFHGFQYVEITGLTAAPAEGTITGLALSSDTPVAGSFACSDPMLNRLHANILWTQRMNFIDIPTDCPQRDERLGWTGDAQVYVATAALNADVEAFFEKWLVDLADGQRKDGQFPMVAPVKVAGDDGGPAWADAGVICPWSIYETYGNKKVLADHYDGMKRFIAFCEKRSTTDLLPPKQYHAFGDWLSIHADTPKDVIYTAYFARSTKLLAQTAEVLGKPDDAQTYHALFDRIKAAFNKAYVQPDGRITGDTQTVYVLAIAFDLLDAETTKLAAQHLVDDIERKNNHLSTGFIGTKDLMLALAKAGRNDVAYRLLHNDTFPSWGFSIRHGATTIWERWDGWTPDKGFQDPGMNSFAHYSFGAVYQWIVENVAGIRHATPGYATITIAPHPGGKLTSAKTTYHSTRGPIATSWRTDNHRLTLDVTIPPNTTATVHLPTPQPAAATESDKPLAQAQGVSNVSTANGRVTLTIGSGTYRFACPLAAE